MDRVFLDANVLFSAAYSFGSLGAGIRQLWELAGVELMTSAYAVEEAQRNLTTEDQRVHLGSLTLRVRLVPEAPESLAVPVELPVKDLPILRAAVQAGATHLLTGDQRHFGALYEQTVAGILILRPAAYLSGRV